MKKYKSGGTICIAGPFNITYAVCNIEYILDEDDSFKYIFTPNYSVIELLEDDVFQGIPGLNLELKKTQYVRENKTPTFISERVPSSNREDYNELLAKVKMDYMDPILYLIRSKEQYSGDKLFVLGKIKSKTINFDTNNSIKTNNALIKSLLENICIGNNVKINSRIIDDSNRKIFYDLLIALYSRSLNHNKELQKNGIEKAKAERKYKGRKPTYVDELMYYELLDKVNKKEISPKDAANNLGISIDKYYRLKKKLQN